MFSKLKLAQSPPPPNCHITMFEISIVYNKCRNVKRFIFGSRKVKIFKRLLWEITGDPSCESQQAVQEVLKNRFQKANFEDSQKISRIEARLDEQQRAIKQLKKLAQSQTKLLQDLTASLGLGTGNEQNATIIDGLSTEYGFRSRYTWLH